MLFLVKRQKIFFETDKVKGSCWKKPNRDFLPFFLNPKEDKIEGRKKEFETLLKEFVGFLFFFLNS